MSRIVIAVAITATLLLPATSGWARDADVGAGDALGGVLLDVAESVTGVDLGAILSRGLLDDVVDSANFVVALQRSEREPDLLEVDPESGTAQVADHGGIVSTVARCAPRGRDVRDLFASMRNHGAFVTVAAQGGTIELEVPVVSGEGAQTPIVGTETITADLSTREGAELLCQATELIQRTADQRQAVDGDGGLDRRSRGPATPDRAGPPDHARAGKSDHVRKAPDTLGASGRAGKPTTGRSGKPDHAGKPAHATGGKD